MQIFSRQIKATSLFVDNIAFRCTKEGKYNTYSFIQPVNKHILVIYSFNDLLLTHMARSLSRAGFNCKRARMCASKIDHNSCLPPPRRLCSFFSRSSVTTPFNASLEISWQNTKSFKTVISSNYQQTLIVRKKRISREFQQK